jgi:hypothetical protein
LDVVVVVGYIVTVDVGMDVGAIVDVIVGVVFVPQDTSTRDSAIRQLANNHMNFFLIFLLLFRLNTKLFS